MRFHVALLLVAAFVSKVYAATTSSNMQLAANPIRRVITTLESLQKKVTEDGEIEAELFDKFQCYCKAGSSSLQKSVEEAEMKLPQLSSGIEETTATRDQIKSEVEQHKQDRTDAKDSIGKATAVREKEIAAFEKDSSDTKANIAALSKAIAALRKGTGGFLQAPTFSVIQKLALDVDLGASDRDLLASFLSNQQGEDSPQTGEIIGILEQMKETMEKNLIDSVAAENEAKASYEAMVDAKKKEIETSTMAIEDKQGRFGELSVKIVTMKEDLEDTSKSLEEDQKFLADLSKNCAKKQKDWDLIQRTRAEELLAISDAIKILNDDDALALFKKTLPTPSFLQIKGTTKDLRHRAIQVLKAGRKKRAMHSSKLDFILLALTGKKMSFEKVIAMIDEMLALLVKEQKDDINKKSYCRGAIDQAEDELKDLKQKVSDLEKAIEDAKGMIASISEEITSLETGVEELDKQVVEATTNRKAEHDEFMRSLQENNAAKELLGMAKNRLNKYYEPTLYKEPPKRELSEQDSIATSLGGTLAPTGPPGGIAGTGVYAMVEEDDSAEPAFAQITMRTKAKLHRAAPPPPPEVVDAYKTKREENRGIVSLIDMLISDLDKQITQMNVLEKDAQATYEQFVADSAAKRTADMKSISEKEGAKADMEAKLQKSHAELKDKMSEVMATMDQLRNLHGECDWLLRNFDVRRKARAGEVESLKQAKAVLSGASYS